MTSYSSGGEVPVGVREQVDAVGDLFLKLEKVGASLFEDKKKWGLYLKHEKVVPLILKLEKDGASLLEARKGGGLSF